MKMNRRKILGNVLKGLAYAVIIGLALYIMFNHLGLIEGLDFGAGAYYYADIPEFAKYVNGDAYTSRTPMWVLIVLFLIWGGIMYRVWSFLDKKLEKKPENKNE